MDWFAAVASVASRVFVSSPKKFNKILENEYLRLYKLKKSLGGRLIKVKTDSVFDCINGVYKEWKQQLGILARNYKIPTGTYRSDLSSNGEAERVFGVW